MMQKIQGQSYEDDCQKSLNLLQGENKNSNNLFYLMEIHVTLPQNVLCTLNCGAAYSCYHVTVFATFAKF